VYSSRVDSGGFTDAGAHVTVTTAGVVLPEVSVSVNAGLRSVVGTTSPGASVVVRSGRGVQTGPGAVVNPVVSDTVTADTDGKFTVPVHADTAGGPVTVIATLTVAGVSDVLTQVVTLPARGEPVPTVEPGSVVQVTGMGENTITGVTGAGYRVQVGVDQAHTYPPVTADKDGVFTWTSPEPLTDHTLLQIGVWAGTGPAPKDLFTDPTASRDVVYAPFTAPVYATPTGTRNITVHAPAGHQIRVITIRADGTLDSATTHECATTTGGTCTLETTTSTRGSINGNGVRVEVRDLTTQTVIRYALNTAGTLLTGTTTNPEPTPDTPTPPVVLPTASSVPAGSYQITSAPTGGLLTGQGGAFDHAALITPPPYTVNGANMNWTLTPTHDGRYRITMGGKTLALNPTTPKYGVEQTTTTPTGLEQEWVFTNTGATMHGQPVYRITNAATGTTLTNGTTPGDPTTHEPWTNTPTQTWQLDKQ
jgi:hypothetical protein